MGNPSTIWAQLSLPNPPVGSIPFVFTDSTTIVTDVVNFFYAQAGLSAYTGSMQPLQLTVFGGLREGFTDTTATPGSVVINKPAGRVKMAAATNTLTVTNTYCFSTSLINLTIEGAAFDATAVRFQVVPANGSFQIVSNANCTAAVQIGFDILNVF